MASVTEVAECLELDRDNGALSVLQHLMGFRRRRVPRDGGGTSGRVSLRGFLESFDDQRVRVNVCLIGADVFTDDQVEEVDWAVYRLREIYSVAGLGVAAHNYFVLSTDSRITGTGDPDYAPTTAAQIFSLTRAWNNGSEVIDVFLPIAMAVTTPCTPPSAGCLNWILGRSPIVGPTDKSNVPDDDPDGAVTMVASTGGFTGEQTARTMAHELGHYFGLQHPPNTTPSTGTTVSTRPNALMTQTGFATNDLSDNLNNTEISTVVAFGAVEGGCP